MSGPQRPMYGAVYTGTDYEAPPNLDAGLYSDGTVGHSGSSTSAERAVHETLSPRRAEVYAYVKGSGRYGATCREVEQALVIGHGSASGALTVLHRGGNITRLTERRGRQEVYVLPEHVNGREESPYRPNSGKSRIAALERQNEALADDLAARHKVVLRLVAEVRRLRGGGPMTAADRPSVTDNAHVDPGFIQHADYCHLQHGMGGMCNCGASDRAETTTATTEDAARVIANYLDDYSLPANYNRPISGETHRAVAENVAPLIARELDRHGLLATAHARPTCRHCGQALDPESVADDGSSNCAASQEGPADDLGNVPHDPHDEDGNRLTPEWSEADQHGFCDPEDTCYWEGHPWA